MRKLNICYVTYQYGNFISGLGAYSTNLINSVAKQGHKVGESQGGNNVSPPKTQGESREIIGKAIGMSEVGQAKA